MCVHVVERGEAVRSPEQGGHWDWLPQTSTRIPQMLDRRRGPKAGQAQVKLRMDEELSIDSFSGIFNSECNFLFVSFLIPGGFNT